MKNIPKRTCIGCNEIKTKKELIRIVKNKEGNIFVDKTSKANGRGAYLCDNIECLEKLIKTKKLERTFENAIDNEIYNQLRQTIRSQKSEDRSQN